MLAFLLTVAAQAPRSISGDIKGAVEPQIAATADNRYVVVFGSGDSVYEVHGVPGVWSKPRLVAKVEGLPLGMRRGPRIAVAGKTWIMVAPSLRKGHGDLLCYRSVDEGESWRGPIRVNDAEGSSAEGLDSLAGRPDGTAMCVWLDIRNGRQTLFGSLLKSNDVFWGANKALYSSPSGSICECCHPSVVANREGGFTVMWRNSLDGNRDMYEGKVTDALELDSATKLGLESWKLKACPMDGGMLTTGKSNLAIWRRDRGIYLSGLKTGTETKLGEGVQPWITQGATRVWVTWLKARNGPLMFWEVNRHGPIEGPPVADDPVVAATQNDEATVVWTAPDGIQATSLTARITD